MRNWWRAFRLVLRFAFKADPLDFLIMFLVSGGGYGLYLATSYGMKVLVDGVVEHSLAAALVGAILIGAGRELGNFCFGVWVTVTTKQGEKTSHFLDSYLVRLVNAIPTIEHQERPAYVREVSMLNGQGVVLGRIGSAVTLNFRTYVTLVGAAALLARISPLLLLLPLFGLPSWLAGRKANALNERAREQGHPHWMLMEHFRGLTTSPQSAKELRVFGLSDEILTRYEAETRRRNRFETAAAWQGAAWNATGALVYQAGFAAAIGLTLLQAVRGQATVGDVLMATSLAAQVNNAMLELVNWGSDLDLSMKSAVRLLWLEDYAAAARPPADELSPPPRALVRGVEFDHVTFRYANSDRAVLEDISVALPAGKMIALVGDNGAGKSTFVKLLCRFYEPSHGVIRGDGIDLRLFEPDAWRNRLAGCFQDFNRFELLLRETVAIGDLPRIDDGIAVGLALQRADASAISRRLPAGLESQLGRQWEAGQELSGGEWQKLALARASMRDAPLLMILDEPTAALDPEAEHALFQRFSDAAHRGELGGAITLVVSHRFSTVRMADLIIVLEKGRVVEVGSHAQLVSGGGLYAELFQLQARAYG